MSTWVPPVLVGVATPATGSFASPGPTVTYSSTAGNMLVAVGQAQNGTGQTGGVLSASSGLSAVTDDAGHVIGWVYGAVLVNRNFGLIDTLRDTIFKNEVIDGKPLGEILKQGDQQQIDEIKPKLAKYFVAHALLANWDVHGTVDDNIIIDQQNNPHFIDNGGALEYRAQGAKKKIPTTAAA